MKILFRILKNPLVWRLLSAAAVFMMLRGLKSTRHEVQRLQQNQQLLLQGQQEVLLANGRVAYQSGVLSLRQKELLSLLPEVKQELELLRVRARQVQSVSTLGFGIQKRFSVPLNDSIAYLPAPGDAVRYDTFRYKIFRYQDAYYDVSGVSLRDTQLLRISTTDTMTQVVYWKRKRPWLWILSPRHLEQRVYFKNPDAHIYYSRTINIKR